MPLPATTRPTLARRIAVTVFLVNALYATTYLGNPMSKSMLDLTVSLVDRRALDIDPYAGNSTDVAQHDGHYYSGMPPGVSWACVPYYLVAKTWLGLVATPKRERATDERFLAAKAAWRPSEKHLTIVLLDLFICLFGCSLMAALMAVLFHTALGLMYPTLPARQRLVTTWLFSFGTLWFIYSPGIYHRTFSTFLCFGAFLLVLLPEKERPAGRWRGFLFGAALGLAIASTYEIVIVAVILVLYALARCGKHWPWVWAAAGGGLFLALLAAYHTACFGAPWATPYAARIHGSVVPPIFRHVGGGRALFEAHRFLEFLVGSRYGVFFYSPLLLLALPALAKMWRGRPDRAVVAVAFAIFGALLAFHFATGYDGLPGEFGFRMMLPAIPFLMLLVPASYRWSYRYVVPSLAALSAVIIGKGVMFGVHAGRPFWSTYPDFIARYGFSNYTLANLKDHLWPALSPLLISVIHAAALALIGLLLWVFVWSGGRTDDSPRT